MAGNNSKTAPNTRKNGKGKPKKKSSVGTSQPRAMAGPSGFAQTKHKEAACSILDPFCAHARGSRRPDGLSQGTLAFRVCGTVPVTTDASGRAMIRIIPGYGIFGYALPAYAAGNWTTPATWTALPGSNFISGSNASAIRLLSMGAKFINTSSMTNCQGMMILNVTSSAGPSEVFAALNSNVPETHSTSLRSGQELTWISKPMGSGAHQFKTSGITNTLSEFTWTQCYFEVSGGAVSSTVGNIEIVVNVEFQINPAGITTTGLGGLTLGTKKPNPIALQTQAIVHATAPSIFQGGVDYVGSQLEKYASNAINDLMSGAGGALAFLGL